MAITNSYYDPDSSMIWMYTSEPLSLSTGGSQLVELGLEDTTFDDVKVKILSVEYRVFLQTSYNNTSRDNNIDAFNVIARSAGQVLCGVRNKNESVIFNSLDDFTGSSGWPVKTTSYHCTLGVNYSMTHTWKPSKLAFSNEQNAFISVKAGSDDSDFQNVRGLGSLVIRAIRL